MTQILSGHDALRASSPGLLTLHLYLRGEGDRPNMTVRCQPRFPQGSTEPEDAVREVTAALVGATIQGVDSFDLETHSGVLRVPVADLVTWAWFPVPTYSEDAMSAAGVLEELRGAMSLMWALLGSEVYDEGAELGEATETAALDLLDNFATGGRFTRADADACRSLAAVIIGEDEEE